MKYPEWTPVLKNELSGNVGMLELIRRKDRFIHVPYHSFDSYIRILQEAAINKEVKVSRQPSIVWLKIRKW